MKKIDLGKISVPLDDYASQGNAILGIRDSGKSYSATAIAERLMDCGIPIIAFDPIGIWRYLRVPGAGKGYEVVVAGGKQGDLPLTPRGAQEIVRAAMRENVSLIVDLYDIHLSKADWREVVASSIRTLLYENGEHGLRHIFIEEAAEFCPQVISPDQGRVYAEVEKLARMGGNALLGYTLINQRAEQVNKAVLELCDCMILHRQKGRNSITALSKWLDIASTHDSKALISSLPGLAQGECWVWPAGSDAPVRTKVPEKNSFHPDRRARQAAPKSSKAVDVSAFVTTMKGSLEALTKEAEANDPKLLRARIAEMERLSKAKPASAPLDTESVKKAEQRGFALGRQEGAQEGYAAGLRAVHPFVERLVTLQAAQQEHVDGFHADMVRLLAKAPAVSQLTVKRQTPPRPQQALQRAPAGHDAAGGNGALSKAGRLILTALAQHRPEALDQNRLAILAGYAVGTGHFNNNVGALRTAGFMTKGWPAEILQAGIDVLGEFEPLPTGKALLEWWCGRLGKAERMILRAGAEAYPEALTKAQLAMRAGYEADTGHFNNSLGRLRTMGLLKGRGEIKASQELFDG